MERANYRTISFFLLFVLTVLASLPYVQTLGDDTFIYMRAIENFLNSGRFEYNAGEPAYIMTSLTWFLAWSGAAELFDSLDTARYVLSILFHGFAFLAVYFLSKRFIKNTFVLFFTMTVIFLDPFYLRWFWGGWEVSLKIAMAAVSLLALLVISSEAARPRLSYFIAGIILGLAFLTRPEMMILAIMGILYLLIKLPKNWRYVAFYVLGFLVITLPWMLYAYNSFGYIIPHTILAKTGNLESFNSLISSGIKLLQILVIPLLPLILLLFVACILLLVKLHSTGVGLLESIKNFVTDCVSEASAAGIYDFALLTLWGMVVFGYLFSGSYIASIKTSLFAPFLAISLGACIYYVLEKAAIKLNQYVAIGFVMLAVLLSYGIQSQLFLQFSWFNPDYRLGDDSDYIDFAKRVNEVSSPSDTIGLWELGVLGYYSDRYIIDFHGLATPEMVPYKREYRTDQQYVTEYLRDTGNYPDFIVAFYLKGRDKNADTNVRQFGDQDYVPVITQKVQRIGGRSGIGGDDNYALYVLYERSVNQDSS